MPFNLIIRFFTSRISHKEAKTYMMYRYIWQHDSILFFFSLPHGGIIIILFTLPHGGIIKEGMLCGVQH